MTSASYKPSTTTTALPYRRKDKFMASLEEKLRARYSGYASNNMMTSPYKSDGGAALAEAMPRSSPRSSYVIPRQFERDFSRPGGFSCFNSKCEKLDGDDFAGFATSGIVEGGRPVLNHRKSAAASLDLPMFRGHKEPGFELFY